MQVLNLLLDTHIFIWFLNGDNKISKSLKDLITDTSNKCYLSIASIWEIAIKISLNKIQLQGDFDRIAFFLSDNEIDLLPITFQHLQRLLLLEFHHRDPFDRIIIAQAVAENITIATKDEVFNKYGVSILWN
ncbi:MAG: type II toxin-antitoxin system VapC family toxin [Ginsengibacter sp.]